MTRTYTLRGREEVVAVEPDQRPEVSVTSRRRVVPGSAREGGVGEVRAQGDEVVRVELENGFTLWTRADDLVRERGRKSVGRDGAGEAWEIDLAPPPSGRSRGLLGLGIKALEFLGIKVNVTEAAAKVIGEKAEARLLRGKPPGFYRFSLGAAFGLAALEDDYVVPAGEAPILVFIHGTGSSAEGSYGKLWQGGEGAAARKALAERYGDRVYALEHRSLTESPIQNALELLAHLPENAQVHLVSHSRGGLVGELLCLGQRDKQNDPLRADLIETLFAADRTMAEQLGLVPLSDQAMQARDAAYQADRSRLLDLVAELDRKHVQVGRFVRVACPARGTTLASGRLDRWLSVLNHFLDGGFAGEALDFLLAVVKERTDPRTLPGLEAMMPGSALTRLLNHPDLVTQADLSVIAGDIEGDNLWGQIKLLATDWFYGADHDLVVNTGSMFGGLRRPEKGARFQFDQGAEVCHFNYFVNGRSVRWLVAGLTRGDGGDGGFLPIQVAKQEAPKWRDAVRKSRAASAPRPLAVVLPGTMGSALKVQGKGVWLDYWSLLRGGLGRMHVGAAGVEPSDLLDDFYGPLLEFLARSHRVEIFPYDWRLSIIDAANKLADKLEDWLPEAERNRQPVHLVAHSMGGLVVRAMIADPKRGAELWRRIVNLPNSRFLMLGTPNQGSYEAVRWLTGTNATEAKLSLLDVTRNTDEIVDIVKDYPGLLELLPFDAGSPDFARQDLWTKLKGDLKARWGVAGEAALAQARDTWTLIRQSPLDPKTMRYVAGHQDATVKDYQLVDYDPDEDWLLGRNRLAFTATARGDGTVTWKSGILEGLKAWYAEDTAHDDLCSRKNLLPGYFDLLMTGQTRLLADVPPTNARAAAGEPEEFPLPPLPPSDDMPGEEDLRGFGFGPRRVHARDTSPVVPRIQVSLCHGDLAYAKYPVLVGHYEGDTIISAEKQLDERLGGALSRQTQLGLYPGPARSHALFFNEQPDGRLAGALVMGLGQVGTLSTTLLHTGVRDVLLDYALRVAQWPDDRFGKDGVRKASVSCLLVGTGPGGLPLRDALEATLRGAVEANERLDKVRLTGRVLIDRIEFLELFQDVAVEAAAALEAILGDGQLDGAIAWEDRDILEGPGRRRRVRYGEAPGWWHRMEIIEEKAGGLRFIASTDRARAEVTQSTGQLRLAEGFIRQASQSCERNTDVAKTLFEMLLPNALKELAPQQENLVLIVDDVSAAYPWELLEDRWSLTGLPPAVVAGLVRQLKTPTYRPRPAHASKARALVVGNPNLDNWRLFPDLPGARNEAQKVEKLLRQGGYRVKSCIDEKYPEILDALHQDAWRILHLAGHGEHQLPLALVDEEAENGDDATALRKKAEYSCLSVEEEEARKKQRKGCISGMVIGKGTFLTPGDVEQMRWVPELVFINCCHLGKARAQGFNEYSQLAANLGVQFIRMGVKAVVAAGWAVDDAAACAFAESFYRHMLDGMTFGNAVRLARHDTWVRFGNVNTWGAYQCYGDPSFRLYTNGAAAPSRAPEEFHSPAELVAELDNQTESIRVQIKAADDNTVARFRDDIAKLLQRVPGAKRDDWLARSDVAAALGLAWGESLAWDQAIECLEIALHASAANCPLRVAEQCANFRVRRSVERWQASRKSITAAEHQALIDEIQRGAGELRHINQLASTPERLSLLGSAHKRLAWVDPDPGHRLLALVEMADYYLQAYDMETKRAAAKNQLPDPYAFPNWAMAKALSCLLDPAQDRAWQATLAADCRKIADIAAERDRRKPNFWDGVGEADCELLLLVAGWRREKETPEDAASRIAALYRHAGRRAASPREFGSVLEHLEFVKEVAGDSDAFLASALVSLSAALRNQGD